MTCRLHGPTWLQNIYFLRLISANAFSLFQAMLSQIFWAGYCVQTCSANSFSIWTQSSETLRTSGLLSIIIIVILLNSSLGSWTYSTTAMGLDYTYNTTHRWRVYSGTDSPTKYRVTRLIFVSHEMGILRCVHKVILFCRNIFLSGRNILQSTKTLENENLLV